MVFALSRNNFMLIPVSKGNTPGGRVRRMRKRILVIEDERDIADLIRLHLEDLNYFVSVARDGNTGLRKSSAGSWDLIILDLRLPGVDGLEICRRLRQRSEYVPILMLTSKSSELDRVVGLEIGADDYVTKPFSVLELMARVKAILRRTHLFDRSNLQAMDTVRVGDLTIDPATRSAVVREEAVELTAREFDLLFHFAKHPGRVFSRAELLDRVWGYGHDGYEHTVNSHINRLRAKIESDPAHPEFIVTMWGVGYKMNNLLDREQCA
jgi:DNA-binding response OmpR family regulator